MQNLIICGDSINDNLVTRQVDEIYGHRDKDYKPEFPLVICDPPYGNIVKEQWDKEVDYNRWMFHCKQVIGDNGTIAMWGGIGKYQQRQFLEFASKVEMNYPSFQIKNWITWAKKRAYGVSDNYLFTREECLILTKGNPTFNIPLLETKRGYAGYNEKYPAKSEFLRRTNVWTDINELFKGKIHPCQKPDALYRVLIETHTNPGDVVYDPCAGSLTTARAAMQCDRFYCCIERDEKYIRAAGMVSAKPV